MMWGGEGWGCVVRGEVWCGDVDSYVGTRGGEWFVWEMQNVR